MEGEMNDVLKGICFKLSKKKEMYLLEILSAKKGEIKTREDLKRYVFTCTCCKEVKPATEAVMLVTEPKIDFTNLEKKMLVEVSEKMALICQECRIKYWKSEKAE